MFRMAESGRMSEAKGEVGQAASPIVRQSDGRTAQAQLAFVRSACGSAEGAIRLADEKVGYVLLFFGILVATLSVRADSLVRLLVGPLFPVVRFLFLGGFLLFLGAAGASLVYAMRSRMLSPDPVRDVGGSLHHLATLEAFGLAEVLVQTLHTTAGIAFRKLFLLRRCLGWAAVAFVGWTAILIMSVAM